MTSTLCLSTTFNPPLRFTNKEIPSRYLVLAIARNLGSRKTDLKFMNNINILNVKPSLEVRCQTDKMLMTNRQFSSVTFSLNYFAKERVICGYWIGPDLDDGWGYVEAVLTHFS